MKYTILGFNQAKAIEHNLDVTDLIILRYLIDFKDTGKMSTTIENEKVYYWFKYDGFIKEYPILSIKKDAIYRRMKILIEKGFLIHTTVKVGGTYSYYNIDKNILYLLSDSEPQGYGFKTVGVTVQETEGGTDLKPQQNNPSTKINPSTKNNPSIKYIDLKFIDEIIEKVQLTKEQYNKLLNKYGQYQLHKEILALDNYIVNGKGNKYKDHYRALNIWCNKNKEIKEVRQKYGVAKQNIKPTTAKTITGEGEELAKRAIEKYGDKLQDYECEF